MNCLVLLLLLLVLASCRSGQLPKDAPKTSASLLVVQEKIPCDTLTFYVTVIEKTDPKIEAENKKLKKKILAWRIAAGVFFFVATGNLLGL